MDSNLAVDLNRTEPSAISCFESILEKKLLELQTTTITLGKTERELAQARQQLFIRESELQTERSTIHRLKTQLRLTREALSKLQDETKRAAEEHSDASIEYACVKAEKETLLAEASGARANVQRLKRMIERLQEQLRKQDEWRKESENALSLVKERNDTVLLNLESQLGKLVADQKRLRESCESLVDVNNRLRSVLHSLQKRSAG